MYICIYTFIFADVFQEVTSPMLVSTTPKRGNAESCCCMAPRLERILPRMRHGAAPRWWISWVKQWGVSGASKHKPTQQPILWGRWFLTFLGPFPSVQFNSVNSHQSEMWICCQFFAVSCGEFPSVPCLPGSVGLHGHRRATWIRRHSTWWNQETLAWLAGISKLSPSKIWW
jgi:hypothetical protein